MESNSAPVWAQRIRRERELRKWSQADAVAALIAHGDNSLPDKANLVRRWKAWEAGDNEPKDFYKKLIATAFGVATYALFPVQGKRNGEHELITVTGMDTLDILARLQASDVDNATLDALRITVDRLCSEYPYMPSEQLVLEGRQWLRRVAELQSQRLTLAQHREVVSLAGWLALLIGCVEYDMGDRAAAEATRKMALSLGQQADNHDVIGWAYEMRAWFGLTTGDYRGVVAAGQAGAEQAGTRSVAVQLVAQEAKAWARLGDRRQVEVALDRGRRLLEALPYPDNLAHHFVVDPSKFDFYAMDCYRILRADDMALHLADEVIRAGTDFDGTERSPMRIAEARVTLGVVAARQGDLEQAVTYGEWALMGDRKSLPSLLMVSRELSTALQPYQDEAPAQDYLDHLRALSKS